MKNALPAVMRIDRHTIGLALDAVTTADPLLAGIVRRHGPPPLWDARPGFPTLVRFVLEQQVSLASGRAAFRRLRKEIDPFNVDNVLAAGETRLRGLGVTRQKASYIVGLAASIESGLLSLSRIARADDAGARAELMSVRGIGSWTADIYLLMALGRPDVWPTGDVALLTAMRRLRGLEAHPSNEEARAIAEAWRPWRSVGARILWHGYLEGSLKGRR